MVDPHGKPLVVYHGTVHTFDRPHDGQIYPVYITIQRPLRIIDDGGLLNAGELAEAVCRVKAISYQQYKHIIHIRDKAEALQYLFALLAKAGYDGLVYENTVEGHGDSWVPFDPERQVKNVFAI